MIAEKLIDSKYQSRESRLFFLKERADKVYDFMKGLRGSKGKVYLQVMAGVTGVEALVTLQSFLLQVSLYYRKTSIYSINELLEVERAHEALSLYYRNKDFSGIVIYLKELKKLFDLIKDSKGEANG